MKSKSTIWAPVAGFEEAYEVSACGMVRSLDRIVETERRKAQRLNGRNLKPGVASTGYFSVALCKDGVRRSYNVHELVAAAFIGKRPARFDIDHINGDRKDNRVENLRYVPHRVNARNITKVNAKSGALGVYWNAGKWAAQIVLAGKKHCLGRFETVEAASEARKAFEREHDTRGLARHAH